MRVIEFCVPGPPVPWHVYHRADNNPRSESYERKMKMNAWQDTIRIAARAAMQGLEPHEGPVHLECWFYRQIPASAPKQASARKRWCEKHILTKPDRTNYLKAAEDALNNIVYLDDSQVTDGAEHKAYAEESHSVFVVRLI